MSTALRFIVGLAGLATLGGCGSRSQYWNSNVDTTQQAYGLNNGIALVDEANHRVVVLTSAADHTLLPPQKVPLGHHFTSAVATPDGMSLLLLSSGDWPLKTKNDDPPSLTLLTIGADFKATSKRYAMSEPVTNLVIDPLGTATHTYAVAYQGASQPGTPTPFTTNPNEIFLFDLAKDPAPNNPRARTLISTGGTPQRFTFTPELDLPARAADANATALPRRLLVVENSFDVSIVDLYHAFDTDSAGAPLKRPDIIIPLSDGTNPTSLSPAGVAIDPNRGDGRIAIRTAQDRNIYTIQLVPPPPVATPPSTPQNDFTPTINLTDVGGNPSDMAFVNTTNTTQGLRVAALVPSTSRAMLVEPDTSATTPVQLASAYSKLSVVTGIVSGAGQPTSGQAQPPDVAMLWTASDSGAPGSGTGVALWTLGNAVGQPYRSIEVLSVQDPIAAIMDVPQSKLKILKSAGGAHAFYVLDLVNRTPSPLNTTSTPNLSVAPDGGRVWSYLGGGMDLAAITLPALNPTPLTTDTAIASVFDIAAPGGARSLVAIHAQGTFGATIFDALKPETATSQRSVALLLEAP